jgi:hypothetical protein
LATAAPALSVLIAMRATSTSSTVTTPVSARSANASPVDRLISTAALT